MKQPAQMRREFSDPRGGHWEALAIETIVSHAKKGAQLAFRPAGDAEAAPLPSSITFNSRAAADFALRTMGEKELQRRLTLAQAEAGTVHPPQFIERSTTTLRRASAAD